jgi:DNA mismatch repair protein MutS
MSKSCLPSAALTSPLFNAARRRAEPAPRESAAEALLRQTHPDELTPREALDLLYRLKGLAAE